MKSLFQIRLAQPSDVPMIGSIAEATELFPVEMLDDMIASFFDGSVPDLWLVLKLNGEVVGFGFCEPERMTEGTWNLLAIGVLPDHQGAGGGAAIVAELEDRLRRLDARVLLVETLGTPEFERTRRFYLVNGFTEEARIRDFYEEGGDKVVFWKRLRANPSS
ncbi:MAG: GNAT family N-acetyltransferase [Acidobacteriota bacterium]